MDGARRASLLKEYGASLGALDGYVFELTGGFLLSKELSSLSTYPFNRFSISSGSMPALVMPRATFSKVDAPLDNSLWRAERADSAEAGAVDRGS